MIAIYLAWVVVASVWLSGRRTREREHVYVALGLVLPAVTRVSLSEAEEHASTSRRGFERKVESFVWRFPKKKCPHTHRPSLILSKYCT